MRTLLHDKKTPSPTNKRPRIYVSVTAEDHTKITKHAENEDLPVGTLARKILLGYLRKHPHVPQAPQVAHPPVNMEAVEQLTFQLQKIGNNINQWTTHVNTEGQVTPAHINTLVKYIKKLDALVRQTLTPETTTKSDDS